MIRTDCLNPNHISDNKSFCFYLSSEWKKTAYSGKIKVLNHKNTDAKGVIYEYF